MQVAALARGLCSEFAAPSKKRSPAPERSLTLSHRVISALITSLLRVHLPSCLLPPAYTYQGLYKGMVPNVMRVLPSSAITFFVYEGVKGLVEEPAGGARGLGESPVRSAMV